MGVGLGGRGKRRRNIGQNHGGAKDCGGVNVGSSTLLLVLTLTTLTTLEPANNTK